MILKKIPTISIQKISYSYKGKNSNKLAISNLDLEVFSGEFVTIIGPSGSGKTTILNLIAGLLSPTDGDISIAGHLPRNTQSRKYIGMVFQTPAILPWLNVSQNLLLPLEVNPSNSRDFENESIVSNILSIIQMEDYASFYPHQLSGGMKQRVGVGMSLVFDPEIFLMDEPLGSLDEITRSNMRYDLIKILRNRNKTIVMVTHSIEDAVLMSDRIIVLSKSPGTFSTEIKVNLPPTRTKDLEYKSEFISCVSDVKKSLSFTYDLKCR